MTKKASEYTVGEKFIDPHRTGRRPAQVMEILQASREDIALFRLHDDHGWGYWVTSYGADEELEMA